ncbi:MAG: deiodinase-like protein [Candidatus Dormibacteria bacterium]
MRDTTRDPELRDLGTPKLSVGDIATDFALRRLDDPEQTVQLSQFRGERPVVLVLGSYSCPPFRVNLAAIDRLYRTYSDRVAFFLVYIKEAHPEQQWVLTWNRKIGIRVNDPTTFAERAALATTCVERMNVAMPVLVDDLDNSVASTYGGWPVRLWLVDRDGRVAYRANEGPFGFKPDDLRRAIEAELNAVEGGGL